MGIIFVHLIKLGRKLESMFYLPFESMDNNTLWPTTDPNKASLLVNRVSTRALISLKKCHQLMGLLA